MYYTFTIKLLMQYSCYVCGLIKYNTIRHSTEIPVHLMKVCCRVYYNDILRVSVCIICWGCYYTHTHTQTHSLTHTRTLFHRTHAYTYIHTNTCTQPRTHSDLDLRQQGMIHAHARTEESMPATFELEPGILGQKT